MMRLLGIAILILVASGQPALAQEDATDGPEPIISDEEFEASIPDLEGQIESIEEWEAEQERLEEEAVRRAGGLPIRTVPASADDATLGGKEPEDPPLPAYMDGDRAEMLPDPAPLDPELEEPLGPIEEFTLEPVDSRALGEDPEQLRDLRYEWRIVGLEGLEGTITEEEIISRFRNYSALQDERGRSVNGTQLSASLVADRQLLTDILAAAAYFDAEVDVAIELPAPGGNGRVLTLLEVQPGPQYSFGSINFDTPPVEPEDLITRRFPLEVGDPILADDVLAAEALIALRLPRRGYPFAEVGQRDILLDEDTLTGDYTLPITPGPRSSYGDVVVEGDPVFSTEHIYRLARFERGELYDSRMVDDLREALVATGLFGLVAVEPRDSGEPAGDGTTYADLVVRQQPGPMRSIAASAGYGTGQGLRAEASWTHRNMFPPEGALIVAGLAGTQEQGASVTFRRSNAGRRDRTVELALAALHSNYSAFDAYTGRLSGRISYDSTPIWQKTLTYSYGFELLASSERSYDFEVGERVRSMYYIAALPGQVGFDKSNDLLDPVRGFRVNLRLSPEASLGDQTLFYVRGMVEGSAYYPFGDFVLAGRVRVGSIVGAERDDIAPSRRYYGGGGGSVRGFGYQELGPRDPEGNPIGGRSQVEAAVEARYRFGDYGVVAFVDAGQVYESSTPGFDDIRFGVGIGARLYTNFGPIRLDVATPINRRPGESDFAVYVSIGQAF